jgi:predicted restriction endonuclease
MTPEQRLRAILALSKYTGFELTSDFLRHTTVHCPASGIETMHSLVEGIFKPKNSKYALAIWSRSAAGADLQIYPDEFRELADGGWQLEYSAKNGPLDSSINRSLFACMEDKQPLLVIVTSRGKEHREGARYRLLGPALLTGYDATSRRFRVTGSTPAVIKPLSDIASPIQVEESYLRSGLILPMLLAEERARYITTREARDQAFRQMVLGEYGRICCLCRSMFVLREQDSTLCEAEAAHIIPVPERGPDDIRNALSLCKRHHWAFDAGLFTVSDANEALVSPAVRRAERQKFDLEEYDGEGLVGPTNPICRPDAGALSWHREHRFRY